MTNRRYIKEITFRSKGDQVHIVLDNGDILDGCTEMWFNQVFEDVHQGVLYVET